MGSRFISLSFGLACVLVMDLSHAATAQHADQSAVKPSPFVLPSPQTTPSQPEFPVRFADIDIITIATSPISSLTPADRAKLIQQNIQTFADSKADIKGLKVTSLPEGYALDNEDQTLLVLTEGDAGKSGKPVPELANEILQRIQKAVLDYRTRHTWQVYGLGATYSLLAIIGLWQALYWSRRLFVWLAKKVSALHHHWKGGVRFKQIELFSANQIEQLMLFALRMARILVVLLCLYFFLPLILSFFPETRGLSSKIFGYLITPFATIFQTLVKYIPNLFFIFVIGLVAFYVLKVISYVFELIEHGELKFDWFYEDWARPTYQIIRFLVIVTALISAYPYIPGSSSQAFQGVGLVLGALISFASSSAISNIVAGVILTYTRAFKLNDRIKIGDTTGDVVDKTLLVTRIKTIKHEVVTIPNSLVMGAQIINYSTSAAEGGGVILHTSVTIGYDVPLQQVQALLIESALATDRLLREPAPFVLQTSLDDFYVSYEINAYTKLPEQMANIYSDLHRNILEKFDAAGVEIMSPHYYALRDGNASAVPSVLGEKDYLPPSFRIDTSS